MLLDRVTFDMKGVSEDQMKVDLAGHYYGELMTRLRNCCMREGTRGFTYMDWFSATERRGIVERGET